MLKGATTVFIDTETGGLEDSHPTIELAAVAVRDWQEIDSLEVKIAFDVSKATQEALTINGYSEDAWRDAVKEEDALWKLIDFCRKHSDLTLVSKKTKKPYNVARLAGHNISAFDIPRLRKALAKYGDPFWPACWWWPFDTYPRAIWYFLENGGDQQPENCQLQTLAKHLGVEVVGRAHSSLSDVRTCVQVAKRLLKA